MKVNSTQYAKTLHHLTKNKSQPETNEAIAGLAKVLIKNKDTRLVLKITEKFNEIWNKENEIVEAEIVSKEKIEGDLKDKLEKFIKEKYKAKEVVLHNKIDEDIKGGVIIKVGGEVIDGSISGQLNNLRSSLEK